MMEPSYRLKLFVTGNDLKTQAVIKTISDFCRQHLGPDCQLAVVDVLEDPHLAEQDRVLATPTLLREWPMPVQRFIGDLSDGPALLARIDFGVPPRASLTSGAEFERQNKDQP